MSKASLVQLKNTPPVLIDPDLVKSTSEFNKENKSRVGDMFGFRTPNDLSGEPLKLPHFTPEKRPEDWDQGVDRITPTKDLIQPRTDLMRTPEEIKAWLLQNYTLFNKPSHYVGHEGNADDPKMWDKADLRILVVRLSTYDSVNGSMSHGAVAQMCRQAGKEDGFSVYVDHAYMPGLTKDCEVMRENKFPWWTGKTSKRHPRDFDIILISHALTLEIWNVIPGLVWSGIAPFKTMRDQDTKIGDNTGNGYPIILIGGVVADFIEGLYGKVEGEECVNDITIIGDGEYTLPRTISLLNKMKKEGKTKREFFKAGHSLPEDADFERDSSDRGKTSWWYEPDLYEHVYQTEPDPKTGFKELLEIRRKPGNEHAAAPGLLKRAVVRDLNKTAVWEEGPMQYDGSLGDSVDIQISSGCLCVAGDTVIETDFGFETIEECYKRHQDADEVGGILVQTRQGIQEAESYRDWETDRKSVV